MRKTARTAEGPPPVTLVLVTDQFHCQRLITAGRQLADQTGTALEVVENGFKVHNSSPSASIKRNMNENGQSLNYIAFT